MTQRIIEVEGSTLEEARTLLKAQIGDGFAVISESIESDGMPRTVRAVAATSEEATFKATKELPANAKILETQDGFVTLRQKKSLVEGHTEEEAREKAKSKKEGQGEDIGDVKLASGGSRGIFGLGAKPNSYWVTFLSRQAFHEISYAVRAKIRATIADRDEAIKFLIATFDAGDEREKQRLRLLRQLCDSTTIVTGAPDTIRQLLGCSDEELVRLALQTVAECAPSVINCLLRFDEMSWRVQMHFDVDPGKSYRNLLAAIRNFGPSGVEHVFEFLRTDTRSQGGARLAIELLREMEDARVVRVIADRLISLDEHEDPCWLHGLLQDMLGKHLMRVEAKDLNFIMEMRPRVYEYQSREIDVNYDRTFDNTTKLDFSKVMAMASEELSRRAQ